MQEQELTKWRIYLWPIHRHELKKFIPLLLIFFLVTFGYNVLRTMKDTLSVTAQGSGAEVIPFIRVWALFPFSLLMTYFYSYLSNRYKQESVVYLIFSLFLLFYLFFSLVLYPMRDWLHPQVSADYLESILPVGCKGFIAMYRNWTFTLFYVMAELWSNVVLFILFWGFANQITTLSEAKRFYGLFGMGANISGIVAGLTAAALYRDQLDPHLFFGSTGWEQTMTMLLALVLLTGLATLAIFYWMNNSLLKNPYYYDLNEIQEPKSMKGSLSFSENIASLFRSRYLLTLAFIVIAYNLVINLVEILWKHKLRELYPHPGDYNLYLNGVTAITGVLATLIAWFITGNSIRKFGWTFTAMLTPLILLVTSAGFFACFFAEETLTFIMPGILGTTPLAMAVFFGSAQNILCRSAKYSVFDSTKEMAFVPLAAESKRKGKAAIDGMAVTLGKSAGSIIHQSLLLTLSSFAASAPYTAALLFVMIILWMGAVKMMGRQFAIQNLSLLPIKNSIN